jgi:tetratricopeptide (TPR) repeat protein
MKTIHWVEESSAEDQRKKIEEEVRAKLREEGSVQAAPQEPQAAPEDTKGGPDARRGTAKAAAFFLKKRVILCAGIAALVLLIGFTVIWSQRDKLHIKSGVSFFDRREYDKAIEEFDKAIAINPKSSDAYSWRGVSYSNKGDEDASIADQTKAIEINPRNALAYSRRATSFAYKKITARARADLEEALRLDPDNAQLMANCGNVYKNLGNREQALAAYTRSIQINPKYPGFYFNRGDFYCYYEEKYEEAISDYNEGLRLNRNNAEGYYDRGYAYYYLDQYDNALADFDEAIRLNPQYTDAYNARGNAYYCLQQYDKALPDFDSLIQLEPENYTAYGNRGNVRYYLQQYENAVADCEQAIRLNPQYAYAYTVRAAAYNDLQRYDEVIADCNEALRLNSQDSYAYAHRGNAYYMQERYDRARMDYEAALLLYPENYFAYKGMYHLYNYVLLEYGNALSNIDEAIRLSPYPDDEHFLLNNRAFLCFYLGKLDEALADINRAIEIVAYDNYIDTRGTIYRAMGDYGRAIEDYSKAISISPHYAIFWMNRAIAHLWSGNQSAYEADRNRAVDLDPEGAAQAWIDLGKSRLQAGLYDTAAEDFRAALAINPESAQARKLLAKARAGR